VPIVVVFCVASALQMLHWRNNFFAMIMAINGHDQQQKKLATMEYLQGRWMCGFMVDCCVCCHCRCSSCGFCSSNQGCIRKVV
jgi:hypothetical protein